MTTERTRRARLLLLFIALLALVAAACGDDDEDGAGGDDQPVSEQGRALETVSQGKLTVCTDIPYAPFEFEEEGKVVGIDAEIVRAISSRLGLTPEFRDTDFEGIFAALNAGQCDVIASSVSITDERKKTVDFSDGYYEIVQSMLVRKADAATYTSFAALKGRTIGVQSGTTGADFAKKEAAPHGITVKEFGAADELFTALKANQIDAVVQDFPVNAYHAKTAGDAAVSARFEGEKEQYGIVVPKGEDALLKAINDALRQIRSDDTYNTIIRHYVGDTA
ncbi:MAG TPA: basic amino acid ABC transporter substrate-binding protein [Acidimicrobiales bacterium]|nr:basic amino acid ABC transporter substrate-binding protein [Acidimicrobiales bacterium]